MERACFSKCSPRFLVLISLMCFSVPSCSGPLSKNLLPPWKTVEIKQTMKRRQNSKMLFRNGHLKLFKKASPLINKAESNKDVLPLECVEQGNWAGVVHLYVELLFPNLLHETCSGRSLKRLSNYFKYDMGECLYLPSGIVGHQRSGWSTIFCWNP